ncbi:sensor histidine kinase [Planomonospora corallina]|uniref:histidine kinase n=1 Tax=Planomonospora corallina TaxID=1806052 RepID=A0ABV8IDH7_9ACTN
MSTTPGSPRPRLHERPRVVDAAVAALLAVAAVACARLTLPVPAWTQVPDGAGLLPAVLGCLATALHRSRPFLTLWLVIAADLAPALLAADAGSPLWLVVLWLVHTIAARRGLAVSLCALAVALAGRLASAALRSDPGDWPAHLLTVVLTLTCWLVGRSLRLRRAYLAELRDRVARTELARAADTRAARAEERSRIARELHDVVAHHVSVMTVQAAAARRVLGSNPDGVREALSAIEETGRAAMAEMRGIVGALRTEGAPAEREPRPGLGSVPALVEQMCEAGLRTRLRIEGPVRTGGPDGAAGVGAATGGGAVGAAGGAAGDATGDATGGGAGDASADGEPGGGPDGIAPLPPGVDLAVYRLVQEALTNCLRHAGEGARAWVTVRRGPGELTVRVEDDGRGPAAGPGQERVGHGLVGIRERVALYGGVLRIGPRPGGGFEVTARFPLKDV